LKKSLPIIVLILIWLPFIALIKTRAQGMCVASVPYAPQPQDRAEVLDMRVTLEWRVDCAVSVELRMNGVFMTTLEGQVTTFNVDAQAGVNTWQVTAIDEVGNRAESPVWQFERDTGNWLATPQMISTDAVIYAPTAVPRVLIDVNAPSVLVSLLCGSLCGGLGLVVIVAWMLGLRAQRRDHQRRWYR
jgi:hypothetical protein